MDHVASVLSKVLRLRGLGLHADAAMVTHMARDWMAKEIPALAGSFSIESFKDGVVVIGCSHSIAAQECQIIGYRLLEHLRKEMPKTSFSGIRIRKTRLA